MKQFDFTIQDPIGIHARPAGNLVQFAKTFKDSEITISKDDKTVKATQLMKLMSMGIKCNDTIRVNITGGDEEAVAKAFETFLKENL